MRIAPWRNELDVIDAELVLLLNRRVRLAVEMLRFLRSETLTLGDADQDANRLLIMLYHDSGVGRLPLDAQALAEIFRRINIESSRLARRAIAQTR